MKLSASSLRVLAALLSETQQGRNPTIRELSVMIGWSGHTNWVYECIKRLVEAELVTSDKFRARTLRPCCRMFLFE